MTTEELRRSLLEVGGYLSPVEAMPAEYARLSFSKLVDRMVFEWHNSPPRLALLASVLARHIEDLE